MAQLEAHRDAPLTREELDKLFKSLERIDDNEDSYPEWYLDEAGEWQPIAIPSEPPSPCVYLIRDHSQRIKIGIARDLTKRLKGLQTTSAGDLQVALVIYTDDPYTLESILHRSYKHRRTRGEWFNLTAADIADIKAEFC